MDSHITHEAGRRAESSANVIDGLNDLLKLNHDAVAAYAVAIERMDDADHADQIAGFRRDHERHILELRETITRLGGTPEDEPHVTGPLKTGLQKIGSLGGDRGTLIAWRINELQVRTKYESYASKANQWPADIKRMVDEQALDEERHYEWVVTLLQQMGIGPSDDLENRITTRMREAASQLESAAHRTRERAGMMASSARNRIADSLDSAADRLEHMEHDRGLEGRTAAVTEGVAHGFHSSATYLRRTDFEAARADLERSAREYPFRTLATLFVVGFVLGRIIR